MISAITNRGALAFMVFQGRFQNPLFIEFMKRLLRQEEGFRITPDSAGELGRDFTTLAVYQSYESQRCHFVDPAGEPRVKFRYAGDATYDLARILASAQPVCVLAEASVQSRLSDVPVLPPEQWTDLSFAAPWPGPMGDDAAYVIYTSGSTGEPKGVVIEHRAHGGARGYEPGQVVGITRERDVGVEARDRHRVRRRQPHGQQRRAYKQGDSRDQDSFAHGKDGRS